MHVYLLANMLCTCVHICKYAMLSQAKSVRKGTAMQSVPFSASSFQCQVEVLVQESQLRCRRRSKTYLPCFHACALLLHIGMTLAHIDLVLVGLHSDTASTW